MEQPSTTRQINILISLTCYLVTKHGQQRGIPRVSMKNNSMVKVIDPSLLPSVSDAVQDYHQAGGHLQDPHLVGIDPLGSIKQEIRGTSIF